MTEFLLFTLYAPLASWGDIAVGEVRGSWDRPSRSAVLGILAAALGIDRADQAAHDALDGGYGVAVRLDVAGVALVDYHTVQTVSQNAAKGAIGAPRAEMLAAGDRETILSRRTYRQDAVASVAVWARDGARWPLQSLAAALRMPCYVLYAGRKSNPLGLPVHPIVVAADSLAAAFSSRSELPPAIARLRSNPDQLSISEVSHDPCEGFPSGLQALRREVRRDAAANRTRWQFAERVVEVGVIPTGSAA